MNNTTKTFLKSLKIVYQNSICLNNREEKRIPAKTGSTQKLKTH